MLVLFLAFATGASAAEHTNALPPGVTLVPHDPKVFRPDPSYADKPYDPEAQLKIYGDKRYVPTTRPLIELGRELYRQGPFQPGKEWLGKKNLVFADLLVSGDWRSALAWNDVGPGDFGIAATRLNLDVDLKITSTERIHGFFRPLDEDNQFTSTQFGSQGSRTQLELDGHPDALFFEGDLGAIASGFSGKDAKFDLPFAFGLIPLLFQNGVWMEDAILGFAFAIPARNSPKLHLSNFDVTFFAGFNKVSSPAFLNKSGSLNDSDASVFGVATFIEAMQGYWEAGYAYLLDDRNSTDASYHNFSAAFTRRYFDRISNSLRVVANVGQDDRFAGNHTANGVAILFENSLVTRLPSTLVPYCNLFLGIDHPNSVARDGGAGGILKNTGILFETDGLTGFPTLDGSANDTWGGALGVEYLFNLNQQIVLEAATVQVMGSDNNAGRPAQGNQYGLGVRYQLPLNHSWILRADAMIGWRDADTDVAGTRVELRYKF
jgi:hypothetical protein